jgi:hypothetical protein
MGPRMMPGAAARLKAGAARSPPLVPIPLHRVYQRKPA